VNRPRINQNALQLTLPTRATTAGQKLPKREHKEHIAWFSTIYFEPNEMEVLFYAFLLCTHAENVSDLKTWAKKVHAYKESAETVEACWQPPKADWSTKNGVSGLYERMEAAFKGVRNLDVLNNISAAMRLWDGPGRADELDGKMLSNYLHRDLRACGTSTKKPKGPPRWRSWSIVSAGARASRRGPTAACRRRRRRRRLAWPTSGSWALPTSTRWR
jgi:hypothetical protein